MKSNVKSIVKVKGIRLIKTFHDVSCRVDRIVSEENNDGLHFVPANEEENEAQHYHRGAFVAKVQGIGVYLNHHFYGLTREDLGRRHNFTVFVFEKEFCDGRVFTYLNLHKAEGSPTSDLKLNTTNPMLGGNVQIHGTRSFIRFVPRVAHVKNGSGGHNFPFPLTAEMERTPIPVAG